MINKKMLFIFVVLMLFSINTAYGAEITFIKYPKGLANWVAPNGFNSADPNDFINVVAVCNDSGIMILEPPTYNSGGTWVLSTSGSPSICDCVFTEDYIYVSTSTGAIYRIPNKNGLITWGALSVEEKQLITTISNTGGNHMAIDNNGYVYVTGGKYVYKINPDTLVVTASTASLYNLYGLSFSTTKMITGTSYSSLGNVANIGLWSSLTSVSYITPVIDETLGTYMISVLGCDPLSNGNYIVWMFKDSSLTNGDKYLLYETNNTYFKTVFYESSGATWNTPIGDCLVTTNGIILASAYAEQKVFTYEASSSGISFSGSNYVPAKLVYDTTDIYTDYQNYYNGSTVDTHYSLSLDMDDQETEFYSKDVIGNRFNWKIELIDPNGVLVNSYNIPENFDRESILSNTWFITSSIAFSNINSNGTYNINLFEIDTNTNEKSLLDSTTFDILFEQSTTNTGIEETDSSNIVTTIISSVYFQAFILIMTCALAGGSVAGGAGLGGGGLIATVSCVFLGLLPYSFAFIIAIVCCAVVALAIADKMGGG